MMPSPSGSVDLQPSFGSGGSPSSFSLRHLSVPSSGIPSPSASGGCVTGALGAGLHAGETHTTTAVTPTSRAIHRPKACQRENHPAKRVGIGRDYRVARAEEQSCSKKRNGTRPRQLGASHSARPAARPLMLLGEACGPPALMLLGEACGPPALMLLGEACGSPAGTLRRRAQLFDEEVDEHANLCGNVTPVGVEGIHADLLER